MLLVRTAEGPAAARAGQIVSYRVTSFNQADPSADDVAGVRWVVAAAGGGTLAHVIDRGPVLEMSVPERWVGQTALVMPYLTSPSTRMAVRTTITAGQAIASRTTPKNVEISREGGRFYASVDGEPPFYLGTRVSYGSRRGLMNVSNPPGPRYRPEDFEAMHGDWAWYLWPTITCESKGYFSCLNTYDRACFTFGHMQLGAHTPNDNFVLLLRELLQEPLAAGYFPDLVLSDGRVNHRSDAGLTPLESDTDTTALMAYLNRTADDVDENETQRAARFIDWCLTSAGARELQVAFAVRQQRRTLAAHALKLPLDGLVDTLCIAVLDILHQGRATYRLILQALDASDPLEGLLSLGASAYRERIATLGAGLRDLEERGAVGQKVYDRQSGEFVEPWAV
jgi:hypothetical protein